MRVLALVLSCVLAFPGLAQDAPAPRMTQESLRQIIADAAGEARVEGNVIVFRLGDVTLVCISDAAADRMRIVAPIKPIAESSPEEIFAAMHANFHSMLDARYAMSNGVIYAAFLHPLSLLTREQVLSALRQVAAAHATFGTSFSGGGPAFGGF